MWRCSPGKRGACTSSQNVITVAADGSVSPHFYKPDTHAKVDCFYVYPTSSEDATPNSDLLRAWKHYLAQDNAGRGIVLIGHSQGASLLIRLLQEEIDGKPIRERIVSAILPGSTVLVPRGKAVGGSFRTLPLCMRKDHSGCVVVYASYRATVPPSSNPPSRYGRSKDKLDAACTNPAALGSAFRSTPTSPEAT
jgi:hypothetical protein